MTAITLPSLHRFAFQGAGTYLGVILHRDTAPRLEELQVDFFNPLTFSVPRLLQFVNTTENLSVRRAKFVFGDEDIVVKVYPRDEAKTYALSMVVDCSPRLAGIFHGTIFQLAQPNVLCGGLGGDLAVGHSVHSQSSEEHNETDPTEWHNILKSFRNLKTLRVAEGLVEELSRCLELDDGQQLPELFCVIR